VAPGPRYSRTIPLLLLPLGVWLQRAGRGARLLLALVCAVGLTIQVALMATSWPELVRRAGYLTMGSPDFPYAFLFVPEASPVLWALRLFVHGEASGTGCAGGEGLAGLRSARRGAALAMRGSWRWSSRYPAVRPPCARAAMIIAFPRLLDALQSVFERGQDLARMGRQLVAPALVLDHRPASGGPQEPRHHFAPSVHDGQERRDPGLTTSSSPFDARTRRAAPRQASRSSRSTEVQASVHGRDRATAAP
jgi:hypothetical protein